MWSATEPSISTFGLRTPVLFSVHKIGTQSIAGRIDNPSKIAVSEAGLTSPFLGTTLPKPNMLGRDQEAVLPDYPSGNSRDL